MYIPAQIYMKQHLLKKETMNLKENQKRSMEVFGEGKGARNNHLESSNQTQKDKYCI